MFIHGKFTSGTIARSEFSYLDLEASEIHGGINPRGRILVDIKCILGIQIHLEYILLYLLRLHIPLDRFDELRDAFSVEFETE
jgi:hypothetical protein